MAETIKYLEKTAQLNKGIEIVPFGLGDEVGSFKFKIEDQNSGGNRIDNSGDININVTTLDTWAADNKVEKIDFIKADIEGHERYMLMGAAEILKTHQPILSICTYHLPDDPAVLKKIILNANPKYRVMQRKKKLYAYVP